jgi:hypothetical protein
MPFTFLAHQTPVLPIKARRPDRWDGLALVVGSMAPDLMYATSGSGYGPWGIPLWFDGHALHNQLALMIFSVLLTLVVRRLVLPVAPLALPDSTSPLRDSLLDASRSRHRIWVVAYSALVGQLTHIALDAFTHRDGYVVRNVGFLRAPWFRLLGHDLGMYTVLQYGGTLVLGVWCAFMLNRWWSVPRPEPSGAHTTLATAGRWLLGASTLAGVVVASVVAPHRFGLHDFRGQPYLYGKSVAAMTWCWIVFAGLLLGCLLARPFVGVGAADHQPRSIHS